MTKKNTMIDGAELLEWIRKFPQQVPLNQIGGEVSFALFKEKTSKMILANQS